MQKKRCCEEPLPVEKPIYEKDFTAFLEGKNVEIPDPKSKLSIITLVQCDSCKTILGRLPVETNA